MSSRGNPSPSRPQNGSKIRLNGLFADAVWRCNCDPRLPAPKFQTKNGGKNHGRWFYTCQKSPPHGCGFFLWHDDARAREAAAVLSNSRNEPQTPSKRAAGSYTTKTPSRTSTRTNRYGPASTAASAIASFQSSRGKAQGHTETDEIEGDDSSDFGDELTSLTDQASSTPSASTAPRKSVKTGPNASPRKREQHSTTNTPRNRPSSPSPTPRLNTAPESAPSNNFSPLETPRAARFKNDLPSTPSKPSSGVVHYPLLTPTATASTSTPKSLFTIPATPSSSASSLKTDIFAVLREAGITLPPATADSIRSICEKHALRALAFERGRDTVRKALKSREADLAKSNERNEALSAELEVYQRLIRRKRSTRESTVDTELTQPLGANAENRDEGEQAHSEAIDDWHLLDETSA